MATCLRVGWCRASRWRPVLVLLALLLAACNDGTGPNGDPPPGEPASVLYRLLSPNDLDGGVLFSAPAAAVSGASSAHPLISVITHETGGTLYVAVLHRLGTSELSVELHLADPNSPPELTLLEVVGPDDLPRELAGYSLEATP